MTPRQEREIIQLLRGIDDSLAWIRSKLAVIWPERPAGTFDDVEDDIEDDPDLSKEAIRDLLMVGLAGKGAEVANVASSTDDVARK